MSSVAEIDVLSMARQLVAHGSSCCGRYKPRLRAYADHRGLAFTDDVSDRKMWRWPHLSRGSHAAVATLADRASQLTEDQKKTRLNVTKPR